MPLPPAITDLEQLKNHPAVAKLMAWNPAAVEGAKFNYAPAPKDVMDRVRRIEAVCARHGVPLRRAALAFAAAHPAVISLVIGAVKPEEVRANAAEMSASVPAALWSELKAEGLLAEEAPTPA